MIACLLHDGLVARSLSGVASKMPIYCSHVSSGVSGFAITAADNPRLGSQPMPSRS